MSDPVPHASPARISTEDAGHLRLLREHRKAHRQAHLKRLPAPPVEHVDIAAPTRGQRLADGVAATIGSWRFIIFQSSAIVLWISGNVWAGTGAWDPYPFILLNLLLSFQAAYTAPAIMMSQNRQSEMDRRHAETDYEINVKAELEIELLHEKIDLMKEREWLALTQAVQDLSHQVAALSKR
ncbi:MAG: DUF1003 domain-containing protein [Pseudomonadota bacterium]